MEGQARRGSYGQLAGEKSKKPGALSNIPDSSGISTTKPQHSAPLARGKSFHRGNVHCAPGQARSHAGHPGDQRKGKTGLALEKVLGLWMVGHGDTSETPLLAVVLDPFTLLPQTLPLGLFLPPDSYRKPWAL